MSELDLIESTCVRVFRTTDYFFARVEYVFDEIEREEDETIVATISAKTIGSAIVFAEAIRYALTRQTAPSPRSRRSRARAARRA